MADILQEKRRAINIIGAFAVLGGIIAPSAFAAFHFYSVGTANVRAATELKGTLSELDGLNKTLSEVESARKQTEARLLEAESRLPNSQSMDDFLAQIAKVEENAGLIVDSTTFNRDLTDAGDYKSLPVAISGHGKWDTCYRFLIGLRSMNRLTRLDRLTLQVENTTPDGKPLGLAPGQEPSCQINVDISTFMAR